MQTGIVEAPYLSVSAGFQKAVEKRTEGRRDKNCGLIFLKKLCAVDGDFLTRRCYRYRKRKAETVGNSAPTIETSSSVRGLHAGEAFEQVGSLFTTEESASAVFLFFCFLFVLRGTLRKVAFLTSAFLARSLDPFQSRHRRRGKKMPSMLSLQGSDGS